MMMQGAGLRMRFADATTAELQSPAMRDWHAEWSAVRDEEQAVRLVTLPPVLGGASFMER
jgi:hypothetical protein